MYYLLNHDGQNISYDDKKFLKCNFNVELIIKRY